MTSTCRSFVLVCANFFTKNVCTYDTMYMYKQLIPLERTCHLIPCAVRGFGKRGFSLALGHYKSHVNWYRNWLFAEVALALHIYIEIIPICTPFQPLEYDYTIYIYK